MIRFKSVRPCRGTCFASSCREMHWNEQSCIRGIQSARSPEEIGIMSPGQKDHTCNRSDANRPHVGLANRHSMHARVARHRLPIGPGPVWSYLALCRETSRCYKNMVSSTDTISPKWLWSKVSKYQTWHWAHQAQWSSWRAPLWVRNWLVWIHADVV